MQAGKLNKKATIKRLGETTDAAGGVVDGWLEVGQAWCGFIALRGGERATAIGNQSTMIGTVFFRYTSLTKTIQVGDVIVVDGVEYTAQSPGVNESMKNQSITVAVSVD